jgi:RNA polymerase sigma-70 factor (ECF subfamily)
MGHVSRSLERALLERLSFGDRDAFWSLWMLHRPHLHAVCYRQMRWVVADADDAVSRSMMLAHAKLPDYAHEIVDVEAWLTRLTCNVCLDIKKERGRGVRKAESLDEQSLTRREATLPEPLSPEDACLSMQMRESISTAIERLPDPLRVVALMRFVQEASYTAIAAHFAITEPNARKRVQQARTMLRPQLVHLRHEEVRITPPAARGTAGCSP